MAHESFEDPDTAALMNELFVCVKVDREERPDVDAICMEACMTMNGQGGWPLNVFLTPGQQPFFAGTYFPPRAAAGDAELADGAWRRRPGRGTSGGSRSWNRAHGSAGAIAATARTGSGAAPGALAGELPDSIVSDSVAALRQMFDVAQRGLGRGTQIPPALHAGVSAGGGRARDGAGDAARDGTRRHL